MQVIHAVKNFVFPIGNSSNQNHVLQYTAPINGSFKTAYNRIEYFTKKMKPLSLTSIKKSKLASKKRDCRHRLKVN